QSAPQLSSPPHTNVANEATSTGVDVRYGGAATTVTGLEAGQGSGNIDKIPTMPHDSPLPRVHTLGSDEGRMQHNELMDLVIKLSNRVVALETDLTQTKKVYGAAFTKLIKKVKRLEKKDKLKKKTQTGVSTASIDFTTANVLVTTVGAEISTASPEVKTASDSVDDIAAKSLVYIKRSATKIKDKERQRIARAHKAASSFNIEEWEDIQARIEADEELAQRYFAQQRAEERRNKPPTQAQQRTYMSNYIKHIGNYKLQQLKRLSFDEIKDLFETTMRRANTFVPMETEIRRGVPELVADSSQAAISESTEAEATKRAAEEELCQQSSKKQKSDELSQEEIQQLMIIVPEAFEDMLKTFDRDDLVKLWSLVQERFNSTEPIEDKEIEIWVELKRLFEPDADDELWKSQKHIHDIT
ncbi:hypothetical protein Tco_1354176, partial [Tanacetum coccineum]